MNGISIGCSIGRMALYMPAFLLMLSWKRRSAENTFYRTLRRSGMPREIAEDLAGKYYDGLSLWSLVKGRRGR